MLMHCEQQIHHKITEMNKGSLSAGTTYTSEMLESEGVYAQRLLNSTTNKQEQTSLTKGQDSSMKHTLQLFSVVTSHGLQRNKFYQKDSFFNVILHVSVTWRFL